MKKGFTLIELLAVIIILALVVLIVSPIVSNVIADAKERANLTSVEGIIKSAKQFNLEQKYNDSDIDLNGNIYPLIDFRGNKPTTAEVYVKDNEIAIAAIYDKKCYYKGYDDDIKSEKLTDSNTCTIYGIETDEKCFISTLTGDVDYTFDPYGFAITDKDECAVLIDENVSEEFVTRLCNGETIEQTFEGQNIKFNLGDILLDMTGIENNSQLNNEQIELLETYEQSGITNIIKENVIGSNVSATIKSYICAGNNGVEAYNFNSNDLILDATNTNILNNKTIENVVIPSKIKGYDVVTISDEAFRNKKIKSVVIPNTITTIGYATFDNCSLENVTIPDSVTTIGEYAFRNNNLTHVRLPIGLTYIDSGAFNHNDLTSIDIPDSVTTIDSSAFSSNKLSSVIIPDTVTELGGWAFRDNNLTKVKLPSSITIIGDYTFYNNKLTSIDIPDSVTTIGDGAFSSNKLNNITIPVGVTQIGEYAFSNNDLNNVTISSTVQTMGNGTFYKSTTSNPKLSKVINKSSASFDWSKIFGYQNSAERGTSCVSGCSCNNVSIVNE